LITARRTYYKHYTKSEFTLPNGEQLYFLELPWRDNEIGKSCIPEGTYIVDRNKTGRHQWYALRNEETTPRTFIELHPATFLHHLEGCLAPCHEIKGGERTSNPVAVNSRKACEKLLQWFGDDSWVLKIEEGE
jgi:hypothetical protein